MNDFYVAAGAVDHAGLALGSWHRTPPFAVHHIAAPHAAVKPEFLAITAAVPAPRQEMAVRNRRPARAAIRVFPQRREI